RRRTLHCAEKHAAEIEFTDIGTFTFSLKLFVSVRCFQRANKPSGARPRFCCEFTRRATRKVPPLAGQHTCRSFRNFQTLRRDRKSVRRASSNVSAVPAVQPSLVYDRGIRPMRIS